MIKVNFARQIAMLGFYKLKMKPKIMSEATEKGALTVASKISLYQLKFLIMPGSTLQDTTKVLDYACASSTRHYQSPSSCLDQLYKILTKLQTLLHEVSAIDIPSLNVTTSRADETLLRPSSRIFRAVISKSLIG